MQLNPAFMDRPLVGLSPEMVDGKPGGVAMAPQERNALITAGRLFGLENMQHGVGANIFVPKNSSHKASQLNGLYFGPEVRDEAIDRATKAGLDVVDNGDGGIIVTSFSGGTADVAKKIKGFAPDLGGQPGRFDSNYVESGLSGWDPTAGDLNAEGVPEGATVPRPQGQGIATKELLEMTGAIPGFEQRLASSNYPEEVAARTQGQGEVRADPEDQPAGRRQAAAPAARRGRAGGGQELGREERLEGPPSMGCNPAGRRSHGRSGSGFAACRLMPITPLLPGRTMQAPIGTAPAFSRRILSS